MPGDRTRPHGEQEVRRAILEAAARLFAERGPAATSLREIAGHAGVNHGLIHRHFGSKRALVGAVHGHLAERLAAAEPFHDASVTSALEAFRVLEEHRAYWTVLTRAALDGELAEVLTSELAGGHRLVETVRHALGNRPAVAAEDLVAMAFAFSFGWLLLKDFIRAATGAGEDVPSSWFAAMAAMVERQVDGDE